MKLRFFIRVTKQDIKNGIRSNGCACPVHIALCRSAAFKKAGLIIGAVGGNTCSLYENVMEELTFKTPTTIMKWITKFDAGAPCKPFSGWFEVNIKEEV
jgi:hypothetical protein